MKQEELWKKHAANISIAEIVSNYHNPSLFQDELSSLINAICRENKYKRVIEIGCETGITNMLLNKDLDKYFLDLNDDVLKKVELACRQLKIGGTFIHEDMFSMTCPDESYDLLFNSGVIEHFDKNERSELLKEYSRVLKRHGTMIMAIPNHYSFPYRSAYLLKKKLLFGYQWPWPEEYRIYDLKEELQTVNLQLIQRTTLAKESIYNFWDFMKPLKNLLLWSDKLFHYEGYLAVLVIKKR